jgi:hypothetical protein
MIANNLQQFNTIFYLNIILAGHSGWGNFVLASAFVSVKIIT